MRIISLINTWGLTICADPVSPSLSPHLGWLKGSDRFRYNLLVETVRHEDSKDDIYIELSSRDSTLVAPGVDQFRGIVYATDDDVITFEELKLAFLTIAPLQEDCIDYLVLFHERPVWHTPTLHELQMLRKCAESAAEEISTISDASPKYVSAAKLLLAPLLELAKIAFSRNADEMLDRESPEVPKLDPKTPVKGFRETVLGSRYLADLVSPEAITEDDVLWFDSPYLKTMFAADFVHPLMVHFPDWADHEHYQLMINNRHELAVKLWQLVMSIPSFDLLEHAAMVSRPFRVMNPHFVYEAIALRPDTSGEDSPRNNFLNFAGWAIWAMEQSHMRVVHQCLPFRDIAFPDYECLWGGVELDIDHLWDYVLRPENGRLQRMYECLVEAVADGRFPIASVIPRYRNGIIAHILHMVRVSRSTAARLLNPYFR